MRLVAGLLAVMLAAPLASADEPAPPPAQKASIPLRVVRVMPESNQALLFDRTRNTHVLVEVGQKVDGYAVDDIGDDEVTLSAAGKQVVLAAPMRGRHGDGSHQGHVRSASADPNAPVDPYNDGVRVAEAPGAPVTPGSGGVRVATAAPSDPYEEPVRVVEAPDPGIAPGEPAPRVVHAPASAETPADPYTAEQPRVVHAPLATPTDAAPRVVHAPAAEAPADPYTAESPRVVEAPGAPAPAVTPRVVSAAPTTAAGKAAARKAHDAAEARAVAELFADTTTATPTGKQTKAPKTTVSAARPGQVTFARTEVDAALSDFGRLADAIHGSFGTAGVTVDGVAAGSLFERAGIRAGDTIASVNGIVPRTLDDAANIYALASSVKSMTVLLVRDGKQTALRIAIQ